MHDLIPHQLHLTRPQIAKMLKGKGINIPLSQMGSDKGDAVILLHPHNAKKMLSAYKKGKGMRLALSPHELQSSITHGRGIGKAFKKLGSQIKKGATKVGDALSSKQALDVYKQVGKHVIEQGVPAITSGLSMAAGDPTGMSGAMIGNVASQYASDAYSKKVGAGMHPADARKEYMALIRSMRGKSEEEKAKIKGSGLFKMLHKAGISKKSAIKGIKDVGKQVVKTGASAIGEAIGAYTGDPVAGAMIGDSLSRAGVAGLDSIQPSKHGIKFDKGEPIKSLKKDMVALGKAQLEKMVEEKIPAEYIPMINEMVPVASMGNGMKRGRGRPRKNVMGAGVAQSKAYRSAMKANYSGLEVHDVAEDNKPVSSYSVNPVVKPSSDEMTLSPYQSVTAPAMNPFIPTRYTQMGGTQSGYGGKGLYGGGLF